MDTIVFDIETSNFFTTPGVGWNNFDALKISVVGIYSYEKDAYVCLEESEMSAIAEYFRNASRIVGFSMNRYDIPVIERYFKKLSNQEGLDFLHKEKIDLFDEIELTSGRRPSLDKLAEVNLGVGKDHHSWEAIDFFKNGEMDKLKEYCLDDVRLTKELYDLSRKNHALDVVDRDSGERVRVALVRQDTLFGSI